MCEWGPCLVRSLVHIFIQGICFFPSIFHKCECVREREMGGRGGVDITNITNIPKHLFRQRCSRCLSMTPICWRPHPCPEADLNKKCIAREESPGKDVSPLIGCRATAAPLGCGLACCSSSPTSHWLRHRRLPNILRPYAFRMNIVCGLWISMPIGGVVASLTLLRVPA